MRGKETASQDLVVTIASGAGGHVSVGGGWLFMVSVRSKKRRWNGADRLLLELHVLILWH
jgi:hypothetical protein